MFAAREEARDMKRRNGLGIREKAVWDMTDEHERYVRARERLEQELKLHKRRNPRSSAVVRSFIRIQSVQRASTTGDGTDETRLAATSSSNHYTSQSFRQHLNDLLLKQSNRQSHGGDSATDTVESAPVEGKLNDQWYQKLHHKARGKKQQRQHTEQQNVSSSHEVLFSYSRTRTQEMIACHQSKFATREEDSSGYPSVTADEDMMLDIEASGMEPFLVTSNAKEDIRCISIHDQDEVRSEVATEILADSERLATHRSEVATEILADSERLATHRSTKSDTLRSHSFADASHDRILSTVELKSSSFDDRRHRFAKAHSLDLSFIKAQRSSADNGCIPDQHRHANVSASNAGDPACFSNHAPSGNITPSVEQYVDRLERIGNEITKMYGDEFHQALSKLSIFDLTYSAFKGVSTGVVGAGLITKDKIWKLIAFGRTAVESVPEDLVVLKQHFEDYTAAVVDEVAEDWLEKNGGWGAMIEGIEEEEEQKKAHKGQADTDQRLTATEWDDFLERVGTALQEQPSESTTSRKCTVSSEDLDTLMQHLKIVLHGRESGHELDELMAHVNCRLHGHTDSNSEIDCMLHQVRRNLERDRRLKQLSVFHSQQVENASVPLTDTYTCHRVLKQEVSTVPDDQTDVGDHTITAASKTGNFRVLRHPSSSFTTNCCTPAIRKSLSAPNLHTQSTPKLKSVDCEDTDSVTSCHLGDTRESVLMPLTRLSVVFAMGVAIGMIILKWSM